MEGCKHVESRQKNLNRPKHNTPLQNTSDCPVEIVRKHFTLGQSSHLKLSQSLDIYFSIIWEDFTCSQRLAVNLRTSQCCLTVIHGMILHHFSIGGGNWCKIAPYIQNIGKLYGRNLHEQLNPSILMQLTKWCKIVPYNRLLYYNILGILH